MKVKSKTKLSLEAASKNINSGEEEEKEEEEEKGDEIKTKIIKKINTGSDCTGGYLWLSLT